MVDSDLRDNNIWIASHDPLQVVRLADPLVDDLGHDVRSRYVETFWLPILGPTAIWAVRRMADWLDGSPDGIVVSLAEFGPWIGIGSNVARHSPIVRTFARLVDFGVASISGNTFVVRTTLAPVPLRLMRNLPTSLLERHPLELEPVQ